MKKISILIPWTIIGIIISSITSTSAIEYPKNVNITQAVTKYNQLPLYFIENKGQVNL